MGKIFSKDKYQVMLGLIQMVHLYETILHDIEKMGLTLTEEENNNGQPEWGGLTSDVLWNHISLEEGLNKLGWDIENLDNHKKFIRKQFKKKTEIIPKKIIIAEEDDILSDILK